MEKAKKILKDIMDVTLSEPKSEVLTEMTRTVKLIVEEYLKNPNIVSYLAKISVHDYSTQLHLINVMLYCMGYAYYNDMGKNNIKLYGLIGLMHDIGKVGIPDYILQAPRKLTENEFNIIMEHPKNGWKILHDCDFDVRVRITALEHHERLDGSGYPDGKSGNNLCETSRMLAIIDVFEALTTWRPYKEPLKPFSALQVIKQDVLAKKLDPKIFRKFAYSIVGITSPEFNKTLF
ncbi:MAG: HD domain-containing protein [Desulfobacteraceae bacterium]|nr:HD domain-containing protein [Desulfobacteraceae bacterium]